MKLNLLNTETDKPLLDRLLKVRGITCSLEDFLNPTLKKYWINHNKLAQIDKAVSIIFSHINKGNKIMIFGDYDVDGITSSYCIYTFFKKYLDFQNVSIMFPNRLTDGYGMKIKHIDMMKEKGIDLIITVDNGITSIDEADHAKKVGIDLVITDHHQALDKIPNADAIVNPQVSPDYEFKGIAGVGVAFKVINALMEAGEFTPEKRKEAFEYFLPFVAIGTVADCVPLVQENRAIVKKGLEIVNRQRKNISPALQGFLEHTNIKDNMTSYHIGFVIGPRINAGGRLASPYDSLRCLLFSGDKQIEHLDKINDINTERRKIQQKALTHAKKDLNFDNNIMIATDESYHEGIVGIVAGRLTDKHNKPSMVLSISEEKGTATGSLRAPKYFNVVEMLKTADHLLERYGGHSQAGGLTVKLENLEGLKAHFIEYTKQNIDDDLLEKVLDIDTELLHHERDPKILFQIDKLEPFGMGNKEPIFLIKNCAIVDCGKVGQRGKGHLKLTIQLDGDIMAKALRRSHGDLTGDYVAGTNVNIIGTVRTDDFNGGYFIDSKDVIINE